MKFTDILGNEETSPEEKLSQLNVLVTKIRNEYGNTDADIPSDDVVTVDGCTPMAMLDNESKLAVAAAEIDRIISIAYEDTQSAVGIVLDKRIEEYVSISPVLNSLTDTMDSQYL